MVPLTAAPPAPSARRTDLAPIRVAVLDVHHPGRDGLQLTALLARRPDSPSVVLHTALLSDRVTLAAAVATVDKAVPASELVATLRAAPAQTLPEPVSAVVRRPALAALEPDDRALVAMRLAGAPVAHLADILGTNPRALVRRLDTLLARFGAPNAVGGGGDAVARCRGADAVVTRRPATQLLAGRGVASGLKRVR